MNQEDVERMMERASRVPELEAQIKKLQGRIDGLQVEARIREEHEKDNEFLFTKRGAFNTPIRTAFKRAPAHTVCERWVKCYLIGGAIHLGEAKDYKCPVCDKGMHGLEL